jgi:RNA polymerase sigma-70 factor, ECF subfamily
MLLSNEEFSARVTEMTKTLYGICCAQLRQRSDYEDAVQECLRIAWQNIGRLRDERYLKTWIIRILINECHRIQRRYKREIPADTIPIATSSDADSGLHDALLRLEPKLRLPIVLHYVEDYSVIDIARMLRLPPGTVKTRMARARSMLREMLSGEDMEP